MTNSPTPQITLTRTQLHDVIRHLSRPSSAMATITRHLDPMTIARKTSTLHGHRRYSASMLNGLLVLAVFSRDRGERTLTDIAVLLGFEYSTAHRYLATLTAAGLLEQNPHTRRYRSASLAKHVDLSVSQRDSGVVR